MRHAYTIREYILWRIAVFKLLALTGITWLIFKIKPTDEYQTLYLRAKGAYERNKTI